MSLASRRITVLAVLPALAVLSSCTYGGPDLVAAELADRCTEAAIALEECRGEVPEGFFAACEDEPTEESLAAIDGIIAAQCEAVPATGLGFGWGETLFAQACKPVMHAGYLVTRHRNGPGRRLRAGERDALRPVFGGLVDRVRVHYDAAITSEWSIAGRDLRIGDFSAQAFGTDLYLTDEYRPGDLRQLALTAHEMTHSHQYERAGSLGRSFENYCRELYKAGFSYRDNALEDEAYNLQSRMRDCLEHDTCGG